MSRNSMTCIVAAPHIARRWWEEQPDGTVGTCLLTRLAVLRLLTTKIAMNGRSVTPNEAVRAWRQLQSDPQSLQKPPSSGAPFPVHEDWSYFPTKYDSMIAATLFLSDADEDAGGIRVYPGSHKLGRLENSSGMQPSESLKPYPLAQATPINATRGDVLFFSYFTLHESLPNRSNNPRKTVLVQMYRGSDYLLDNSEVAHVNEQLVLAGWNHHMSRARAEG
jgi:ectoine hydroxylase-related dioxygenase (phytanoyl-CoA dioxygenase family)